MRISKGFGLVVGIIVCNCALVVAAQDYEMNVIPSWGDIAIVHGRGVDAAMDSPQAIANIIKHWKGRGFTGVYLRTDLAQMDPNELHRNSLKNQENPRLAVIWKYVDEIMEQFDVHVTMQREADVQGFKYWAYHPHLFSDGAPEDVGIPGTGRMVPWSYCMRYTYEHPEVVSIDRKGNRYWMIREYAYPGARSSKVAEFVYMAKKFGIKRFIADLRSEVLQILPAPDKADQYGFNEPVVNDMKTLFGVDIMTDTRFDVYSPDFDPCNPMVQNWYNLRGTYFTQLLRELREGLNAVDPNIKIAIPLSGDHVGPPMGNWRMDWRTWVDEGLVDEIISAAFFEATIDKDSASKAYLTNVIAGKGTVPFTTIHDYIKKSRHHDIKIISTSAPSYFYSPPPAGADGWRCDVWYDSYTLAWYQRWEQWKKDLKDFGYIKFLEQNFDTFPKNNSGYSGGWGDGWHVPKLRACPGCWYKLGDGSDAKPVTQDGIRHGDKGNAVKLTGAADGRNTLIGWHASAPDRSNFTDCLDNAITNGDVSFEFWLYRSKDESSVSVYFQSDDYEKDVGLHISHLTGKVSYSNAGKWTECSYDMPVGQWQKFTIKVNMDKQNYSAYAGDDEKNQLCNDVKYSVPKSRQVTQHGMEHVSISVPAYRMFKIVQFIPEGSPENVTYVDDVLVKWKPTLYYTQLGENIYFADDFESYPAKTALNDTESAKDGRWAVSSSEPNSYYIENTTSYGEGVKCLRALGGTDLRAFEQNKLSLDADTAIMVDFDVYIRSNSSFPYLIPDPTTTSDHRTTIGLQKDSNTPVAAVFASDGTWQYYDGDKFVDSKIRIAYDVWNHVQMAIDASTGLYKIVVQPIGELPTPLGTAKCGGNTNKKDKIYLSISPSKSEKGFSCYDNVFIAYGQNKK
ncbi:MAG: family 10 glycosylhydrolase [Sedimentisphaerales bacterium]